MTQNMQPRLFNSLLQLTTKLINLNRQRKVEILILSNISVLKWTKHLVEMITFGFCLNVD